MTKLHREDLLEEAKAYVEKIEKLLESGQVQESQQLLEQTLSLWEKLEDWEAYIQVRNKIGDSLVESRDIEDFEVVERYLEETLKMAQNRLNEKNQLLGETYNKLGFWYAQIMLNPLKAKPLFEIALQINLDNYGESHSRVVMCYSNLSYVYGIENADNTIAITYAEKAVYLGEQLLRKGKGEISPVTLISSYINLSAYYQDTQNKSKSLHYLELALQKCHQQEFPSKGGMLASIYFNFSDYFYRVEKNYEKALEYAEKTLETLLAYFTPPHIWIAFSYHQLGVVHRMLENYTLALGFLQKGLDMRCELFKTPNTSIAISFYEMGDTWMRQKEYLKAVDCFQKAFQYIQVDFEYTSIYDNPVPKVTNNTETFFNVFCMKAYALWQCFIQEDAKEIHLAGVWDTIDRTIELLDMTKMSYQTQQSTLSFLSNVHVSDAFNLALKVAMRANQPKQAFNYCEKSKANVLLAAMQESLSKVTANIPVYFLEREKDLKSKLTFLEKQIAKEKAKGKQQQEAILLQWKSQFFDLHQEYLQLIQQFEQDYPNYYQLKYETKTVSIETLQQNLTDNQIMVNYFVGESHYYLFLITSNDFEAHEFEKPEDFEALIEDFLEAIHEHKLEGYAEKAYELYQALLQPIEHHLIDAFEGFGGETLQEKTPKELIIIPHGILSYLPFEALLCSSLEDSIEGKLEKGENAYQYLDYLLLHCEVSYHYSATLWHYLWNVRGERAAVENDFVGFAPVYESVDTAQNKSLQSVAKEVGQWATRSEALRSNGTWTPLPHSKVEAEAVASLFEEKGLKTRTFLHEEATKEQFQEVVENSRFLLIAAHGVVNDEQPKLSGLVFFPTTGGERQTVDGAGASNTEHLISNPESPISNNELRTTNNQHDCILSMEETYHLNLKADLVVLSSCESGIGELAKGEGMMAVNRGFLYAGAKNVVSTLFKVYDKPSSLLTQYLFEGVLEGKGYTEALRAAKLRLMQMEEVDVKSWCGFVLIG